MPQVEMEPSVSVSEVRAMKIDVLDREAGVVIKTSKDENPWAHFGLAYPAMNREANAGFPIKNKFLYVNFLNNVKLLIEVAGSVLRLRSSTLF